jgi:hypothetical protein
MNKGFEAYSKTYSFGQIKDKLDTYGIWHVRGEDPNCDFGGHHYQPSLGYYEGVLRDVINYALTLKGFYTWGAGGDFEQINIVKVDEDIVQKMQDLKEEQAQLEKRLEEIKRMVK